MPRALESRISAFGKFCLDRAHAALGRVCGLQRLDLFRYEHVDLSRGGELAGQPLQFGLDALSAGDRQDLAEQEIAARRRLKPTRI